MNKGYRAWGALKSVLSNRGLGIMAKQCLYEGVIVPTALYVPEAWGVRRAKSRKRNVHILDEVIKKFGWSVTNE